jgi:hypothetical protein
MLKWQGNESRIQKVKLHSYIACKVAGVDLGDQHGYPLLYASKGIGSSRRDTFFSSPSLESWHHRCHK